MKKIAFFMFSDYTKSWLDSGILDEIAAQSNLIIYGKKTVIKKIRTYAPEICVEEIPEFENSTSTQRLQLISLINRRSESISFKFRLKRLIFGDLRLVPKGATPSILAQSIKYNSKRFIKFTLDNPVELISFIIPLGRIFENLLRKSFKKNSEKKFGSLVLEESINLAIIPSAAIENEIYEFIEFLSSKHVNSAICIENWDNLTSKSILISIPNYVFVMGNQCKNHGIQIQKIKSSQIIVAGLPRFNPYRKFGRRSSKLESTKFKKFRILYLGFSVPHNERNLISELISLLDLSELKDKYEFYYKPHPARQKRFFESPYLPANVQIIENPIKASGFDALPTIDPKHIQNLIETDVVISTPTSMAIESMLLSIPTIIDATNDGVHRTTAAFALKNYLHLQDLKTIEGIMIGSSASELLEHLLHNFRSPNLYPAPNLENLIESKRENYASHILELAKGL